MDKPSKIPVQEPIKNIDLDIISRLPNNILITVMSLLPIDESARTASLSKKWLLIWESVQESTFDFSLIFTTTFDFVKNMTIASTHAIDGAMIESVLSTMPMLETFSLVDFSSVANLTIRCDNLKPLAIIGCRNLRKLGLVFSPKLVSFKYFVPDIEYVFSNVPSLVEATFINSYCYLLALRRFKQIKPILKQLRTINIVHSHPRAYMFPELIELRYVTKIRLDILVLDSWRPFFQCGYVLNAFKFLHVFSVHISWPENIGDFNHTYDAVPGNSGRSLNLQLLEVDGFISEAMDLEVRLVKFLVSRTASIAKVIVRVARRSSVWFDVDVMDTEQRELATASARERIAPILPRATIFELR